MSPELTLHIELILILVFIGIAGGFLSGLLGVGGGIVFVPALYFCLTAFGVGPEHAMHISVGTSLASILVTGASSAFWHQKKGSIDFIVIKNWWPYIVAGTVAGTFFASSVDGHTLRKLFTIVTILIAIYMTFSKEDAIEPATHRVSITTEKAAAAFIGIISSLIGIGGAILSVPFMTYIGVPMRKAVGTGGAIGCVIALPAMIGYVLSGLPHADELPPYSFGFVNLLAVAIIIPLSMFLSPVGVHVSHSVRRNALRRIFAVMLVIVSLRMFMSA